MQRPSMGLVVLFGALVVPVWVAAAGRMSQSQEEQGVSTTRERLEADAAAQQDRVKANAQREREALEAQTRQRQEALDHAAQERQAQVEARLDAAAEAGAALEGVITSVNAEGHVVTIREQQAAAGPVTPASTAVKPLMVAENVTVEHAGETLSLRDVQVGDRVQLRLDQTAVPHRVQHILITERLLAPHAG